MKNNEKKHVPFASKFQLILCVVLCPIAIAAYALLRELTSIDPIFISIAVSLLYLLGVSLTWINNKRSTSVVNVASINQFLEESGSEYFKNSAYPVVVIDSYGTFLWYNTAMHDILDDHGNFIGSNIMSVLEKPLTKENFGKEPLMLFDRLYKIEAFEISSDADGMYLATLTDVTDLAVIEEKYTNERVAVAYVAIDNIEDMSQYVHDKYRNAISDVEDTLESWANSMNAILKSYETDKYVLFFDSASLENCITNKFDILEKIRNCRVTDSISITVSMGVSKIEGTLADRETAAREALDMALQRGGDQVVYKSSDGIVYYGGRTKSIYKRSNVQSRTFANQLSAVMAKADNVIVMGHRFGDFDSFGASIGIIRLAMLIGIKANIAVDMRDSNIHPLVEKMQELDEYKRVFVDSAEAFDLVGPDTVIVLVDHNTFERAQYSDIVTRVKEVVIIDHHRKSTTLPDTVKLSYIEPSSSSTCELVAEMLEATLTANNLTKEEANFLLAGILLDTKQFTRNTGTRTFGAAQYLRGVGANPVDVYDLFKIDPNDLAKEARFHTSIAVYRDCIAISSCEGDTDETYRVIASKAADKMLTLKNVEASFTIVNIGDQIHISGRSNGKINVQLILEGLNGGGHFAIAGAQVNSESITEVLETLKSSIDDYIDANPDIFE